MVNYAHLEWVQQIWPLGLGPRTEELKKADTGSTKRFGYKSHADAVTQLFQSHLLRETDSQLRKINELSKLLLDQQDDTAVNLSYKDADEAIKTAIVAAIKNDGQKAFVRAAFNDNPQLKVLDIAKKYYTPAQYAEILPPNAKATKATDIADLIEKIRVANFLAGGTTVFLQRCARHKVLAAPQTVDAYKSSSQLMADFRTLKTP